MPSFTLPRTGSAPVRIDAERIAHVETTAAHDKERCWYTLSIYRLDDGRFAYTVGFRSGWEKEKPWDWAVVVRNETELVAALEDVHEPPAVGWPPHPKYELQNRKFFAELEAHYRSAVQRAIEESGIVLGADDAMEDVISPELAGRIADAVCNAYEVGTTSSFMDENGDFESADRDDLIRVIMEAANEIQGERQ